MQNTACTQMRGAHLIDGAGHWLEQEQPEQVTQLLVQFLQDASVPDRKLSYSNPLIMIQLLISPSKSESRESGGASRRRGRSRRGAQPLMK